MLLSLLVVPLTVPGLRVTEETTCKSYHFVHIGKTGGTMVWTALSEAYGDAVLEEHGIHLHGHDFRLGDGPEDACYFFFVRDPIERWVSGWLSRFRRGCPAHCQRWSPAESRLYTKWRTPSALAEAMGSSDPVTAAKAQEANNATLHTSYGFAHYLPNLEQLLPRIVFVGRTEELDSDLPRLCRRLGLPERSLDPVPEHQNPAELEWMKAISGKANSTLTHFLERDYSILETLHEANLIPSLEEVHKRKCSLGQKACVISTPAGFTFVSTSGSHVKNASSLEDTLRARWGEFWAERSLSEVLSDVFTGRGAS